MIEISEKSKIGILGGGSWATAILKMMIPNLPGDHKINWYVRKKETAEYIRKNKHNPNYLGAVEFDVSKIFVCAEIGKVVENSDILVLAIPSAFLHTTLKEVAELLPQKFAISAVKGIVPEFNLIVGEYLMKAFGMESTQLGVITGPCHAEEIAMERLSYLTIVSENLRNAEIIANRIENPYIKTILSDDLYGTEYAAVLKNIYALATGISLGLGYGDNFMAVLIARAIQETKRFIDTVHPIDRDIKDSAYLGDLLVTSYSQFSRNRSFGMMIGKGYSVKSAQLEMNMIAEGYYAAKSIMEINSQYNIFMPIAETVYNILYRDRPPAFEFKILTDKIR
jgi:glycerol-3-phosphate dehydrogenase (NAD(P)+)